MYIAYGWIRMRMCKNLSNCTSDELLILIFFFSRHLLLLPQVMINSRGLVYSVVLLLGSVALTVSSNITFSRLLLLRPHFCLASTITTDALLSNQEATHLTDSPKFCLCIDIFLVQWQDCFFSCSSLSLKPKLFVFCGLILDKQNYLC